MWGSKRSKLDLWPDDRELVRRLRAGEESAFEEFFELTFQGLYRFALARVDQDSELAKDLAQAAICKALDKLSTYRGEAPLFSWVCSFCRFEISAHFRRERRVPPRVRLIDDSVEARGVLDSLHLGSTDPESELLRREVARRVHLTLDHLPAQYGRALEWRYADGLTVGEIAGRLAITYKAAESLLSRSRQSFRDGFSALSGEPHKAGEGA